MRSEFFSLAKLNEGRRSSATLTGVKQRQRGIDTRRFNIFFNVSFATSRYAVIHSAILGNS